MDKEKTQRFLAIQELAMADEEYQQLMQEHADRNKQFLEIMQAMLEAQRAAVFDYLGVLVQMHFRMLELGCQ